jgi:hypothetical protein
MSHRILTILGVLPEAGAEKWIEDGLLSKTGVVSTSSRQAPSAGNVKESLMTGICVVILQIQYDPEADWRILQRQDKM